MKNIDIIGACCDLGVHVNGSKKSPKTLEKKLNKEKINNIINIYQKNIEKELDKENKKKNLKAINIFNAKLYNEILNTLENGKIPLTIGGDHSISIASSLASIKKNNNLGIIWFDAHGDFNTFKTTTSGNIHGLPLAAITNYEKEYLTDFHNSNFYNPKNAVLLGARDIDLPGELNNLKDAGITIITTEDIKQYGTKKMYERAFQIASNGTNGIHISYDLDVIDPIIAPGVSIPVKNGLNKQEAYDFLNHIIINKDKIKSIDLVEFNPAKDVNQKTEQIANHIINEIIDKI